jgi:hypothetical protein
MNFELPQFKNIIKCFSYPTVSISPTATTGISEFERNFSKASKQVSKLWQEQTL